MAARVLSASALTERLRTERLVAISVADWSTIATEFDEIERYPTGIAGDLLVIRTAAGPAAVEQPNAAERVVRLLKDEGALRLFIQRRMEQYERMWDGCGCNVDYYS